MRTWALGIGALIITTLGACGESGEKTKVTRLSLTMDGSSGDLRLDSNAVNANYVGVYPNPQKLAKMDVTFDGTGNFDASCYDGVGAKVDCEDHPFFSAVMPGDGTVSVKIYDLFGEEIASTDFINDTGTQDGVAGGSGSGSGGSIGSGTGDGDGTGGLGSGTGTGGTTGDGSGTGGYTDATIVNGTINGGMLSGGALSNVTITQDGTVTGGHVGSGHVSGGTLSGGTASGGSLGSGSSTGSGGTLDGDISGAGATISGGTLSGGSVFGGTKTSDGVTHGATITKATINGPHLSGATITDATVSGSATGAGTGPNGMVSGVSGPGGTGGSSTGTNDGNGGSTGGSTTGGSTSSDGGTCPDGGTGTHDSGTSGGSSGSGSGSAKVCDQTVAAAAAKTFCDTVNDLLAKNHYTDRLDCSKLEDKHYTKASLPEHRTGGRCHDFWGPAQEEVKVQFAKCYGKTNQWVQRTRWELIHDGVCRSSPIVLDLDGDGVNLSSLDQPVSFDLFADGDKVKTAWIDAHDGLLALDRNSNGTVDDATELFGNLSNGEQHSDGFSALSDIDANHDGFVDTRDPAFGELRVWRDVNHDGVSQPGELLTLRDAGVKRLMVDATRREGPSSFDAHGNEIPLVGGFIRNDGSTGRMVDAWFRFKQ